MHVLHHIAVHLARIVGHWFGEPGLLVCWLGGFALWVLLWAAHVQAERRRGLTPPRQIASIRR